MKTEIATGATIKAVEGFDAAALKKAETVEKNSLPDQEGMINKFSMKITLSFLYKIWMYYI